jgi:single-strand DNA-binding protein
MWRRLAEIAGQYLQKGTRVYLAGSLKTRKWQDQSGADRYTTEIQVRDLIMLDARASDAGSGAGRQPASPAGQGGRRADGGNGQRAPHNPVHAASFQAQAPADFDDDIPF